MVALDTLSIVLTGIGMMIAITYYTLTLRNATTARKAQLFMGLYEAYKSPEFRNQLLEIYNMNWESIEDAYQKYSGEHNPQAMATINSVAAYFTGVGILVKRGLIDIELVDEMLSYVIIAQWEKLEPIIMDIRRRSGTSKIYNNFEYIYHEIKKRSKE
jgi:hypothetical protein